jgi:drug/metabolite transporter (DMT)-like permease
MSSSAVALAAALGCSICYGIGSVVQQIGARRATTATSIDPRLIWRLGRELPYVMGLALDLAGFLLSLVALRSLPLFLVQSAVASSIAVTAVVAWIVLRTALDRLDVVAIAVILGGLLALALSAASDAATPVGPLFRAIALAGVPVLVVIGTWAARSPSTRAHTVLAAVAGLAFTGTAIAGRTVVVPDHLVDIVREPLAWALIGYGGLGVLLFTIALQRGSVTITTAVVVSVETVVPTIIGVVWLGDRARDGLWPLMIFGCAAAIAGAVGLALRSTEDEDTGDRAVTA